MNVKAFCCLRKCFFLYLFFSYILLLQLAWAHLSIGQRNRKSNKSRLQKVKQVKAWNLSQCNENLIMKNGSLKILWKILINHNLLLKTAQLAFALQALIIPLFSSSSPSPPFPFLFLVLFDSCFFEPCSRILFIWKQIKAFCLTVSASTCLLQV